MDEERSKILSQEERDSFTGTTIDEEGNTQEYNDFPRNNFRHFSVHTGSGCGVWALGALIVVALFLGMFIFVLPYYLIGIAVCGILGWLFNSFW